MECNEFMKKLHQLVCNRLHVDYEKSFTKTHKREYVQARQWTMWITYKVIKKTSLSDVGLFFNKDHATVLHAKNKIKMFCETERGYSDMYEEVYNKALKLYKNNKQFVYISPEKLINNIKKIIYRNVDINISIELNNLLSELKTKN